MDISEPNSIRYAPPEGYYDRTANRPLSDFLAIALELHSDKTGKTALDLGCGSGSQTRYMLEGGYTVTAVDGNAEASEYIDRLPHQDRVTFVQSAFETFNFGEYDLVNSLHALSFTHKDKFMGMLDRLVASVKPGGIFAGQLYGVNDEWNKAGETMTFLSRSEVGDLFNNMRIVHFDEKDQQGTIADNSPKHWHTYSVVAVKDIL